MTHQETLQALIKNALAEDIGAGDITSQLLIPEDATAEMVFVAREPMVVCGVDMPMLVYAEFEKPVAVRTLMKDGQLVGKSTIIAIVSGDARTLLAGERVSLNLMQRMSGVATLTRRYVDAVEGTKAKILDTRKTMPGLRVIDKYAVRMGGGVNHRMRLDDAVLVKDNHLAVGIGREGLGIRDVVEKVQKNLALIPNPSSPIPIIVECDTLEQLVAVLPAKPDRIMLDNMTLDMMREAVKITAGTVPLEATGGVSLITVRAIAETGVDFISVGAITHSAPAVDIGLDVKINPV